MFLNEFVNGCGMLLSTIVGCTAVNDEFFSLDFLFFDGSSTVLGCYGAQLMAIFEKTTRIHFY